MVWNRGGISKYNPYQASKQFENFTSKNGLASSRVYSLIFDNDGNLWVGTNMGIDKMDIKKYNETMNNIDPVGYKYKSTGTAAFKHYGYQEGFTGIETNTNAVCKDKDGNLWFGTIRGAIKYRQESDKPNEIPPIIQITGVKLFSTEVGLNNNIDVRHDQNHLTFNYIGISHRVPEKVVYQYKL